MTPPVFAHGHLRLYLLALLNEQPRHGYELIQALTDRFDGTYAPSAGTIYPRLAKLEAEGLVTKEVDGRKTIYRITEAGRQEVADRADELADIEADVDSSVRRLARELRDDLTAARDRLRSEFSAFQDRSAGPDGPTWGSDFGKKAGDFAKRAADAANAGWSAGETHHRAGADFGASATAAFHAASETFTGDHEGAESQQQPGGAAGTGPGSTGPGSPGPGGTEPGSTGPGGTGPGGSESGSAPGSGGPADAAPGAPDFGTAGRRADDQPRPQDAPVPRDSLIARRADLSLDRFRQDIRQDLRKAEVEGRVDESILALIDAELGRVRDLLHHVLTPRT